MKYNCKICDELLPTDNIVWLNGVPNRAQYFLSIKKEIQDSSIFLCIKQCLKCGTTQHINEPVIYYKNVIRTISNTTINHKFNQISEFIEKYNLINRPILEVGSGTGEYLNIINLLNAKGVGIEYCEKNRLKCISNGLNVKDDFNIIDKYDAFISFSYLEHRPDIINVLKSIYNSLNDDAVGLIEVPNYDMILKNKMVTEFIVDHVFYFTVENIKSILLLNGFDILDIKINNNGYVISVYVKKRSINKSVYDNEIDKLKDINTQIKKLNKRIAIYGAGHQALTVIALIKLTPYDIVCVIDDSEFKQNRYTIGTNIPIKSFDSIKECNIDCVIIIAGSYTNSIISKIPPGIEIYTLTDNILLPFYNKEENK